MEQTLTSMPFGADQRSMLRRSETISGRLDEGAAWRFHLPFRESCRFALEENSMKIGVTAMKRSSLNSLSFVRLVCRALLWVVALSLVILATSDTLLILEPSGASANDARAGAVRAAINGPLKASKNPNYF